MEETTNHKVICYYIMNNGCVEEQQAMFERPDIGMMNHFKPLFIQAKVNNIVVNKEFIDGSVVVKLMPHFLLKMVGKFNTDLHPHNIVLFNYEGKTSHILGII